MFKISRWLVVGAAALAGVVVATTTAISEGHGGPDGPLSVIVTAAGTARSTACSAEDYAGTFFDGATITVSTEDGTEVGQSTVSGPGQESTNGCLWSSTFADLPESEAYTIELRYDVQTPPRVHTYTFTREKLREKEWSVWVSAVR